MIASPAKQVNATATFRKLVRRVAPGKGGGCLTPTPIARLDRCFSPRIAPDFSAMTPASRAAW
jgi:hypothetical protein